MSTGKRGADKLNIIGVVVVGICGAVLTYVSIVALEAYYMNETSAVERTKAHAAPNSMRNRIRDTQTANLDGTKEGTISIAKARELVMKEFSGANAELVPGKPGVKPTVEARYGRPPTLPPPAPAPTAPPTEPVPAGTDPSTTTTPTTTDPGGTPGTTNVTTNPPAGPGSTAQPTPGPTTPPSNETAPQTPTTTPTTPPPTAPGGNAP